MTFSTDRDPYNQRLEWIREQIEAGTMSVAESVRLVPEWASRAAIVFGDHLDELPPRLTAHAPANDANAIHATTAAPTAAVEPLPCIDCGATADVESLQLDNDDQLLADTAACREHADPYLAEATDVVWLDANYDADDLGDVDDLADDLAL